MKIHYLIFVFYTQFATEFSRFSLKDSGAGKLFQNLLFLIRDWVNQEDFAFGYNGGNEYIKKAVFMIKKNHHKNMRRLRRFIEDSFESIQAFLMPHPGFIVAGKKGFNGSWAVIDKEFVKQLKILVPSMLAPENLAVKKIAGEEVTGEKFYWHIKFYMNLFSSTKITNAKSIYESTVIRFLQDLVTKSAEMYKELMMNGTSNVETHDDFDILHLNSKNQVIELYNNEKKMGGNHSIVFHRNSLIGEIEKIVNEQNHTIYLRIENNMKTRELEAQRNETLRELQKVEDLRKAQEVAELKANETLLEIQKNIKKLSEKNKEIGLLQNTLKEQKYAIDDIMKKQEETIKELHEKQVKDRQEAEERLKAIKKQLQDKDANVEAHDRQYKDLLMKIDAQNKIIFNLQQKNHTDLSKIIAETVKHLGMLEIEKNRKAFELERLRQEKADEAMKNRSEQLKKYDDCLGTKTGRIFAAVFTLGISAASGLPVESCDYLNPDKINEKE
jgi:hypothetical protein